MRQKILSQKIIPVYGSRVVAVVVVVVAVVVVVVALCCWGKGIVCCNLSENKTPKKKHERNLIFYFFENVIYFKLLTVEAVKSYDFSGPLRTLGRGIFLYKKKI